MTEEFIEIWQEERSLWDIKSQIYKDRNTASKLQGFYKEKLNMEGKYVLFT